MLKGSVCGVKDMNNYSLKLNGSSEHSIYLTLYSWPAAPFHSSNFVWNDTFLQGLQRCPLKAEQKRLSFRTWEWFQRGLGALCDIMCTFSCTVFTQMIICKCSSKFCLYSRMWPLAASIISLNLWKNVAQRNCSFIETIGIKSIARDQAENQKWLLSIEARWRRPPQMSNAKQTWTHRYWAVTSRRSRFSMIIIVRPSSWKFMSVAA